MAGYRRSWHGLEIFLTPSEDHRKIEQEVMEILQAGGDVTIYTYGRTPYIYEGRKAA